MVYSIKKKKREKGQDLSQELDEASMKLLEDLAPELESTTQEPSILLG